MPGDSHMQFIIHHHHCCNLNFICFSVIHLSGGGAPSKNLWQTTIANQKAYVNDYKVTQMPTCLDEDRITTFNLKKNFNKASGQISKHVQVNFFISLELFNILIRNWHRWHASRFQFFDNDPCTTRISFKT